MCGFVGFTNHIDNSNRVLQEMLDKIKHRGPDAEGTYIDEDIALGHRRLSIIDVSEAGTQPLYSEDGNLVLVFNGEIYNYQEIRARLMEKGYHFATQTDSEVLIYGYREYGAKLLDQLRGMFAFVIWDKQEKTLFGARDFFGIKPLYYAQMGETLKDTTKIVSGYADILVMRHPVAGAAKAAALSADCPVINAGDSGHLHPTQTLTDLLTLQCEKGRLDHLTIGLCGDLINGRTVHSLLKAMSCFPGNRFILISTPELSLPSYVKDILNASGCEYEEISSLEEALPELDVLYMTRIQEERFASREAYLAQKDTYVLTVKKMQAAKKDLIVLHPLPRVNEITLDVDDDPRAAYFDQVQNGVYMRMALIMTLLGLKDPKTGEVAFNVEG